MLGDLAYIFTPTWVGGVKSRPPHAIVAADYLAWASEFGLNRGHERYRYALGLSQRVHTLADRRTTVHRWLVQLCRYFEVEANKDREDWLQWKRLLEDLAERRHVLANLSSAVDLTLSGADFKKHMEKLKEAANRVCIRIIQTGAPLEGRTGRLDVLYAIRSLRSFDPEKDILVVDNQWLANGHGRCTNCYWEATVACTECFAWLCPWCSIDYASFINDRLVPLCAACARFITAENVLRVIREVEMVHGNLWTGEHRALAAIRRIRIEMIGIRLLSFANHLVRSFYIRVSWGRAIEEFLSNPQPLIDCANFFRHIILEIRADNERTFRQEFEPRRRADVIYDAVHIRFGWPHDYFYVSFRGSKIDDRKTLDSLGLDSLDVVYAHVMGDFVRYLP